MPKWVSPIESKKRKHRQSTDAPKKNTKGIPQKKL